MTRSRYGCGVYALVIALAAVLASAPDQAAAQSPAPAITRVSLDSQNRVVLTYTLPAGWRVRQVQWNRSGLTINRGRELDQPNRWEAPTGYTQTAVIIGTNVINVINSPGDYHFQLLVVPLIWTTPGTVDVPTQNFVRANPCPTNPSGFPWDVDCWSNIAKLTAVAPPPAPAAPQPAPSAPQPAPAAPRRAQEPFDPADCLWRDGSAEEWEATAAEARKEGTVNAEWIAACAAMKAKQPPSASAPALPPVPPVGGTRDGSPGTAGSTGPAPGVNAQLCATRSAGDWNAVAAAARQAGEAAAQAQAVGCATFVAAQQAERQRAGQPGAAPAAEQAARGTVAKGVLKVIHPSDSNESTAMAGTAVGPGDTVVTQSEGATIAIDGGSRIDAGPNAKFTLGDGTEAHVEQQQGRLFYSIASREWRVKVVRPRGSYSVAVRGTQFSVDVAEDGAGAIAVVEGVVEVTSGGKTVTVRAGSSLAVRPGEALSEPGDAGTTAAGPPAGLIAGAGALLLLLAAGGGLLLARRRSAPSPSR